MTLKVTVTVAPESGTHEAQAITVWGDGTHHPIINNYKAGDTFEFTLYQGHSLLLREDAATAYTGLTESSSVVENNVVHDINYNSTVMAPSPTTFIKTEDITIG